MKICIKSCLVAGLGLFFFYLIIQQIFTLRAEGYENFFDGDGNWFDEDPFTNSDAERVLRRPKNIPDVIEPSPITPFERERELYDSEKNSLGKMTDKYTAETGLYDTEIETNKGLSSDLGKMTGNYRREMGLNDTEIEANKGLSSDLGEMAGKYSTEMGLYDTLSKKMSKEAKKNVFLQEKLKNTMKDQHRMRNKIHGLNNELTKKDDELSKIESELFKQLQKQNTPHPTQTPNPKPLFGTVKVVSKTLQY